MLPQSLLGMEAKSGESLPHFCLVKVTEEIYVLTSNTQNVLACSIHWHCRQEDGTCYSNVSCGMEMSKPSKALCFKSGMESGHTSTCKDSSGIL